MIPIILRDRNSLSLLGRIKSNTLDIPYFPITSYAFINHYFVTSIIAINPISKKENVGVLDKINYLFSGTLINNGTAIAVVISTGMKTEIGKIQQEVQEAGKETKDEESPLKQRINEFGDQLAKYISYM